MSRSLFFIGANGPGDGWMVQMTVHQKGSKAPPPVTPDGRYIVVRGRLWRATNPQLSADTYEALVRDLMDARRAVGQARRAGDPIAENAAHAAVNIAKIALGEHGAAWWDDGAPDLNRHMVRNTDYSGWYDALDLD